MKRRKSDPYAGFNFVVEIGDESEIVAGFHELSGLSSEGDAATINKPSANNIVLKRGLMRMDWLQALHTAIEKGRPEQQGIKIVSRANTGDAKWGWRVERVWPTKIDAPIFKAVPNEVAIETLELRCEGITVMCH
jgi:phage tail-like protein